MDEWKSREYRKLNLSAGPIQTLVEIDQLYKQIAYFTYHPLFRVPIIYYNDLKMIISITILQLNNWNLETRNTFCFLVVGETGACCHTFYVCNFSNPLLPSSVGLFALSGTYSKLSFSYFYSFLVSLNYVSGFYKSRRYISNLLPIRAMKI